MLHNILIQPPYTLDLEYDMADPEVPDGTFQVLKNYIPERDCIRTREGITIFSFTPV